MSDRFHSSRSQAPQGEDMEVEEASDPEWGANEQDSFQRVRPSPGYRKPTGFLPSIGTSRSRESDGRRPEIGEYHRSRSRSYNPADARGFKMPPNELFSVRDKRLAAGHKPNWRIEYAAGASRVITPQSMSNGGIAPLESQPGHQPEPWGPGREEFIPSERWQEQQRRKQQDSSSPPRSIHDQSQPSSSQLPQRYPPFEAVTPLATAPFPQHQTTGPRRPLPAIPSSASNKSQQRGEQEAVTESSPSQVRQGIHSLAQNVLPAAPLVATARDQDVLGRSTQGRERPLSAISQIQSHRHYTAPQPVLSAMSQVQSRSRMSPPQPAGAGQHPHTSPVHTGSEFGEHFQPLPAAPAGATPQSQSEPSSSALDTPQIQAQSRPVPFPPPPASLNHQPQPSGSTPTASQAQAQTKLPPPLTVPLPPLPPPLSAIASSQNKSNSTSTSPSRPAIPPLPPTDVDARPQKPSSSSTPATSRPHSRLALQDAPPLPPMASGSGSAQPSESHHAEAPYRFGDSFHKAPRPFVPPQLRNSSTLPSTLSQPRGMPAGETHEAQTPQRHHPSGTSPLFQSPAAQSQPTPSTRHTHGTPKDTAANVGHATKASQRLEKARKLVSKTKSSSVNQGQVQSGAAEGGVGGQSASSGNPHGANEAQADGMMMDAVPISSTAAAKSTVTGLAPFKAQPPLHAPSGIAQHPHTSGAKRPESYDVQGASVEEAASLEEAEMDVDKEESPSTPRKFGSKGKTALYRLQKSHRRAPASGSDGDESDNGSEDDRPATRGDIRTVCKHLKAFADVMRDSHHLRPCADCTHPSADGRSSDRQERKEAQNPNPYAQNRSPPKRKKVRSRNDLDFEKAIRNHTRDLLGDAWTPPEPQTIAAWNIAQGAACSVENFKPDLCGKPGSPWNQSVANVFITSFKEAKFPCAEGRTSSQIRAAYFNFFQTLRRNSKSTPDKKERVKQLNRRYERKRHLYERRRLGALSHPDAVRHVAMIDAYDAEGMSSDESSHEYEGTGVANYAVTYKEWRHPSATACLRMLDGLYRNNYKFQTGSAKNPVDPYAHSGSQPHVRICPREMRQSRRVARTGLSRVLYNPRWLKETAKPVLDGYDIASGDDYDFSHTEAVHA